MWSYAESKLEDETEFLPEIPRPFTAMSFHYKRDRSSPPRERSRPSASDRWESRKEGYPSHSQTRYGESTRDRVQESSHGKDYDSPRDQRRHWESGNRSEDRRMRDMERSSYYSNEHQRHHEYQGSRHQSSNESSRQNRFSERDWQTEQRRNSRSESNWKSRESSSGSHPSRFHDRESPQNEYPEKRQKIENPISSPRTHINQQEPILHNSNQHDTSSTWSSRPVNVFPLQEPQPQTASVTDETQSTFDIHNLPPYLKYVYTCKQSDEAKTTRLEMERRRLIQDELSLGDDIRKIEFELFMCNWEVEKWDNQLLLVSDALSSLETA